MKFYQILEEAEAREISYKIHDAAWQEGKARTKALTGTVKQNEEILDHPLLPEIGKRLAANNAVQLDCIPKKIHAPKFSRYRPGQAYQPHTDAPWMKDTRTDISCTLWLSDDYEGGYLRIDGQNYKGKPGQALIYDCGLPHQVTPITSGERICVVTWMQSRIRDAHKRRLVADLRRVLARLEDNPGLYVEGGRIHSALLRMWTE